VDDNAWSPPLALEPQAFAERSVGCPWLDEAVYVRVPLPCERRRRVHAFQGRVEYEYAAPADCAVPVRERRACGLVERGTPVGAESGQHAGPGAPSCVDRDDALPARRQLDRGTPLGDGPA